MQPEENRPQSRPGDPAGLSGEGPRGRRWLAASAATVEAWLGRPLTGCLLLGVLGGIYAFAYLHHPLLPDGPPVGSRTGWWSWWDQHVYWQTAAELAQGRLTAASYYYAPGYPALGALFWRFMPAHPFLVPDLLLVLGAAAVWWRLARCWLNRTQTLAGGGLFLLLHRDLLALTVMIPWNTIATQLTLLAGMLVMLTTRGPRTVWRLTALAALTYLFRPGDAACFAPMLVWAVLRLPRWRERLGCAAGGVAGIGAVVLTMGLVNLRLFGRWSTPYESMTWQEIGFFAYPVAAKAYWIFVDGAPFFGEDKTALLFNHPWLFLAVPGLIQVVRTHGMAAVAVLATLGLNWGLYLGYNDFFPSGLYRFSLIHYLTWGLAPLFAFALAALLRGWRLRSTRLGLAGSAVLLAMALGLHMEPRELTVAASPGRVDQLPPARPLWVSYPGVALDKAGSLRLDGRILRENLDYQIPYVPADLRLLMSARAKGITLAPATEGEITAIPTVGDYAWRWRFDAQRWRSLWH